MREQAVGTAGEWMFQMEDVQRSQGVSESGILEDMQEGQCGWKKKLGEGKEAEISGCGGLSLELRCFKCTVTWELAKIHLGIPPRPTK